MKSISVLRLAAILLCCMYLLGFASLQAQVNKWVNYTPNLTTVLKNPAMGWMMYEEGWSFQGTRHNKSNIYTPEQGFDNGTIFPELNKPFYGRRGEPR